MKPLKLRAISAALFALALASAACSDDPTNNNPDGGVNNQQDAAVATCDPNAGTESVKLLNATLEPGVDVITKMPRHPGAPGPNGLP